jgi:hypothetical protein
VYDPKRGYPTVVPCILYDDLPAAGIFSGARSCGGGSFLEFAQLSG